MAERKTMTVKDAANYSGLSKRTIWRLIGAGKIKATKPDGITRRLVDLQSLDAYLQGEKAA